MPSNRDLPTEVLLQVAQYLNHRHIIACSLVCRSWSSVFRPKIWTHVKFGSREQKLPIDVLNDKAPWIESLELEYHSMIEYQSFSTQCWNLRSLAIESTRGELDKQHSFLIPFRNTIKKNRKTLHSLSICNMSFPNSKSKNKRATWSPLLSLAYYPQSNLRSLKLEFCDLPYRHLRAFWEICGRLEVLVLKNVPFELPRLYKIKKTLAGKVVYVPKKSNPSSDHQQITVDFSNLLELSLDHSGPKNPLIQLEHIIRKASKLKKLHWITRAHAFHPINRFLYLLTAKQKYCVDTTPVSAHHCILLEPCSSPCWPDLKSLSVREYYLVRYFTSEEFVDAIGAMKNMSMLPILTNCISTPMIDSLIKSHSHSLTNIDLRRYRVKPSVDDIHRIVSACPNLVNVRLPTMHVQSFMAGVGTWSCFNSLEELSVNIEWDLHGYTPPLDDLTDEELQDQSMALYEILARFRNIKVLDLQNVLGASRFQFVLSMGLSLLSGLTNLEVIKFPGRQEMRPQDVEWIIENLVSLRVFGGRKLTTGYSRYILRECPWDCALATMFNASGIKTPGSVYSDSFKSKCGELDWTLPVSEPEVDDVVEKQDMMDTVEDWNVFDEDIFQ